MKNNRNSTTYKQNKQGAVNRTYMKQTQNIKRTNVSIFNIKIENNTKFLCDNLPFDDVKISKWKRVDYNEELQIFAECFSVHGVSRGRVIKFYSLLLTC